MPAPPAAAARTRSIDQRIGSGLRIEVDCHAVEEALQRNLRQHVRRGRQDARWQYKLTRQFTRAHQVPVARIGIGLAFTQRTQGGDARALDRRMVGVEPQHAVGQLQRPLVVARCLRTLHLLRQRIDATRQLRQPLGLFARRQRLQGRWIAVEPSQIAGKHTARRPRRLAVELLQERRARQMRRQRNACRNFVGSQTLVDIAQGLIVQIADAVAVVGQGLADQLRTDQRTGVARHQNLGIERPHRIQGIGPLARIAIRRAANRIEVRKRLVDVVARQQDAAIRQPHIDLVVGFTRRMHQLETDTSHGIFETIVELPGGTQGIDGAVLAQSQVRADADVDHFLLRQLRTVHAQRTLRDGGL